jgi:hypothetical protein
MNKLLILSSFLIIGCAGPIRTVKLAPGVSTDDDFLACGIYVKKQKTLYLTTPEDCETMILP